MRKVRMAGVILAMAAAAVTAACGNDNGAGPGTADLSGNYNLLSLTQPPSPKLEPPIVTGTLSLTTSTYGVEINITVPTPTVVADTGTYILRGDSIYQTSNTPGQPQAAGKYSVRKDTLFVNVSTLGVSVQTVWKKQ